MSSRRPISPAPGPDAGQVVPDPEAHMAAQAIAGLRRRLRRLGSLDDPLLLRELAKLDEQIAAQLDQSRAPGRHRSQPSTPPGAGSQTGDACGYDLKPIPLAATTPAEFIAVLWEYRAWSGDPSWRQMAARSGHAVVHSTMHQAMNGTTLPKLDVVKAIITGCGGSDEDLQAFTTAWRLIRATTAASPPATGTSYLTAPPPLQLISSG